MQEDNKNVLEVVDSNENSEAEAELEEDLDTENSEEELEDDENELEEDENSDAESDTESKPESNKSDAKPAEGDKADPKVTAAQARKQKKFVLNLNDFNIETLDLEELFLALPKDQRAHSIRVSLYGSVLYRKACELNSYPEDKDLNKSFIKYIPDSFRFHDIGKAACFINKKIRSSGDSMEKNHPSYANSIYGFIMNGYDTLSRDKKISYYIAQEAAVGHHENWNGFGYPEGKKELSINIFARVCKIANDYDNLIVKEKNSHSDAMKKMIRSKGVKYDPILIDVLKQVEKTFVEIHNYLKEENLNTKHPNKIYAEENISNILLGRKGRIRNGMMYNKDLFEQDQLRPVELLYTRIVDIDNQGVPFVEGNVIINSDIEGTLFPNNYEFSAKKSDRFQKLNRWSFTEVSTIHESWEVKFQRDIKFLLRLDVKTLIAHEAISEFINYLTMLGIDSYKVAFEVPMEDVVLLDDEDIASINESMSFLKKTYGYEFVLNGVNPDYPSYDIIMHYDFDYLKVDYKLYRYYSNRSKVITTIDKLSDLCRELGTRLIFTNIRDKGEAKLLAECGITLMGGAYFGELTRIPQATFFKVSILD